MGNVPKVNGQMNVKTERGRKELEFGTGNQVKCVNLGASSLEGGALKKRRNRL